MYHTHTPKCAFPWFNLRPCASSVLRMDQKLFSFDTLLIQDFFFREKFADCLPFGKLTKRAIIQHVLDLFFHMGWQHGSKTNIQSVEATMQQLQRQSTLSHIYEFNTWLAEGTNITFTMHIPDTETCVYIHFCFIMPHHVHVFLRLCSQQLCIHGHMFGQLEIQKKTTCIHKTNKCKCSKPSQLLLRITKVLVVHVFFCQKYFLQHISVF